MNCEFLTLTRKNKGKDFSVDIDGDYELRCIKNKTKKNRKEKPTSERSEGVSLLMHRNEWIKVIQALFMI